MNRPHRWYPPPSPTAPGRSPGARDGPGSSASRGGGVSTPALPFAAPGGSWLPLARSSALPSIASRDTFTSALVRSLPDEVGALALFGGGPWEQLKAGDLNWIMALGLLVVCYGALLLFLPLYMQDG